MLPINNISKLVSFAIKKKSDFVVGYRCLNKLDKIIKAQKDKNNHLSKTNIIYKINCNNCDASYVCQTKRQLRTRLKEHINNNFQDSKLDSSRYSVVLS